MIPLKVLRTNIIILCQGAVLILSIRTALLLFGGLRCICGQTNIFAVTRFGNQLIWAEKKKLRMGINWCVRYILFKIVTAYFKIATAEFDFSVLLSPTGKTK